MPTIYHITTRQEWQNAIKSGKYEASSLAEEGFIHCSQAEQISGVLQRYFPGKQDLVKLTIDTDKLESQLIYEWSPSTEDTFPHIYGAINLDVVTGTESVSSPEVVVG